MIPGLSMALLPFGQSDNTLHSSVKALVDTLSPVFCGFITSQAVYHVLSQQMTDMGISPDEADSWQDHGESAIPAAGYDAVGKYVYQGDQSREEWISSLQYYAAG